MAQVLAQDLRNAVLQAAILGKVTSRLKTDSSTAELIKKLQIQNDEFKPVKKNEYINDHRDFQLLNELPIPEEWCFAPIGLLCKNVYYGTSSKSSKTGKVAVLRMGNLQNGSIDYSDLVYTSDDEEIKKYRLSKGDLLFNRTNSREKVGKTSIFESETPTIFAGYLIRLTPLINSRYLNYVMQSSYFKSYCAYVKKDAIGQSNINSEKLKVFEAPVPPIEEQARIVARIDELMAKIDEYEKIEKQLIELKKSFPGNMKDAVLQAAMQGKLTEQLKSDGDVYAYINDITALKAALVKEKKLKKDKTSNTLEDEYPFDIPDNWAWTKLGVLANLRPGKTPPRAEPTWWGTKEDIPWVSIADMVADGHVSKTKEFISQTGFEDKFKGNISPAGTMIMSFKLTVGRVSLLDIDALHNEAIISIFPFKDEEHILQSYLFKVLPYLTDYGNSKNAIKGTTLNADSLCNLYIPLPPIEEQKRIVEKLDQLLPLCEQLEKMTA